MVGDGEMKLTDIEAAFANAAKAKKIADEIPRLEGMLDDTQNGCEFSIIVDGPTIDQDSTQIRSGEKFSGVRILDVESRRRIAAIIKAEIDLRIKEIESL